MERRTEKSFQLSAGRQRLLAETIRELKQEGRLDEEKLAMQHGTTSIYRHSLNVAYTSLWMMERWQIRLEPKITCERALLHDYFLCDWHQKDSRTACTASVTQKQRLKCTERLPFKLKEKISSHVICSLWIPVPPQCREAWIVCLADKWCALGRRWSRCFT